MDVPNNGGHGKHLTRIHLNLPLLTEQATVSGVTDGGQGGEPPPPSGKLNIKIGLSLADILIFSILLFVAFCVFRNVFILFN